MGVGLVCNGSVVVLCLFLLFFWICYKGVVLLLLLLFFLDSRLVYGYLLYMRLFFSIL